MTMIETRPTETTHASFGVSNAAETFWILIDQIYSDNMSFVRESTSNARDAHVMAGTPERPIVVHLPTLAEPWFSVRDYGPSMDHRMVTEVYTSIGKSTKTLDDSQVGAYGLGSKAAFAYTHAFKVITIIDRVKRTYQAGVEEETRIPTLDLVSTEVCEEENGVEVIVPIEERDIDACVRAGKALGRGFHPTLPICNYDITPETPIYEGVDWRLYPAEGNFGVRMGCVIYPIPRATALNMVGNCNLNWQYSMTIDVPIGSVHTTAAREALKFSDKTNETLAATFPRAIEDLRIQLLDQVRNADGMREAMRLRDQNNQIWKQDYEYQGRPIPVNFRFADIPVYKIAKRGSYEYMPQINFGLDSGKETKFVIDRGQHMVRRKLRLYTYNSHNHVRVLIDPTAKQLERLIRVLQIPRENIVSIVNLPDVRVARAAGEPGGRTVNTGVYDHYRKKVGEEDLPETFDLWLPIERGNSKSIEVPGFGRFDPRHGLYWVYSFGAMCGLPEKPYMLTPKAQKQYEINDFSRYDLVLRDAIEEMLPLFLQIHHDHTLKNNIQKRAIECGIFEFAPGMMETDAPEDFPLDQFIKAVYGQWRSPYFLWLKSEYEVGYTEAESRAKDKVDELKAMYPLVFDNYDKLAIRTYMELMTERLK